MEVSSVRIQKSTWKRIGRMGVKHKKEKRRVKDSDKVQIGKERVKERREGG